MAEATSSSADFSDAYDHTKHLKNMIAAVDAVISGSMSQREASKAFGIPRSTLRCHLPRHETYKHKVVKQPGNNNARGKAVFSKKEEKELVDFIVNMHRCGFGRTRQDTLLKMQESLNKGERKTKFENNMPTDEWFTGFMERHKDSIKECIINFGTQEKGIMPVDVFAVNQVIEEAVTNVVNSPNIIQVHQAQPQQQQAQIITHQQPQQPQQQQASYHQLTTQQATHHHQTATHNLATHPSLQHLNAHSVSLAPVAHNQQAHLNNNTIQAQMGGTQIYIHRPTPTARTVPYPFQL